MSKTYAQLAREIATLQASAQKQLAIESKDAVAKINDMIAKYNLSAGDLKFASSVAAPVKSAMPAKAAKGKSATVAKRTQYSDGQGNVWGGRGPRPAWLRTALAAGRAIESFLTGAAPAALPAVAAVPAKKVAAKKVAVKTAASKRVVSKPVAPAKKVLAVPASSSAVATAKKVKAPVAKKSATKKAAPAAAPAALPVAVKKAASKKAPAKKAVALKRAAEVKPAQKVAAKKVAAGKKTALKAKPAALAAELPVAPTAEVPAPAAS